MRGGRLSLAMTAAIVAAGCGSPAAPTPVSERSPTPVAHRTSFGHRPVYSFAMAKSWDVRRQTGARIGRRTDIVFTSYATTHHPSGADCEAGIVLSDCVPAGGAAVRLMNYGRWHHQGTAKSFPRLKSPPPLLVRDAVPIEGIGRGYGLSFRRGGWKLQLQIAVGGGRMSPGVRRRVQSLVESLRVRQGARRVVARGTPTYSARSPANWEVHRVSGSSSTGPPLAMLTSFHSRRREFDICDPRQLFSRGRPAGSATVELISAGHGYRPGFPARSRRFDLDPSDARSYECGGRFLLRFRVDGWNVQAEISVKGNRLTPRVRRQVEQVLNTLKAR